MVLITGETGTGKEFHAKAIHYLSQRGNKKFLPINCAGIPESLLEGELLGHVKGSFTDAKDDKKGILELVGDGTLFLDEIGDMTLNLQTKMLRVIEYREFYRIGDYSKPYKFKGRIISATNKDLEEEIKKPSITFRSDLYYRINILPLKLQPLRNVIHRKLIISCLNQVIRTISVDSSITYNPKVKTDLYTYISPEAFEKLEKYKYPGNYCELINILKYSYLMSRDMTRIDINGNKFTGRIELEDLPEKVIKNNFSNYESSITSMTEKELLREYYNKLLEITKGNKSKAGKIAGIGKQIYQRCKNYVP